LQPKPAPCFLLRKESAPDTLSPSLSVSLFAGLGPAVAFATLRAALPQWLGLV